MDDKRLQEWIQTGGWTNGQPWHFRFTRDGKRLLFLRASGTSEGSSLYELDLENGEERLLLGAGGDEREVLTVEEQARRERLRLGSGIVQFTLAPDDSWILVPVGRKILRLDRETREVQMLLEPREGESLQDVQISPDGQLLSFVRAFNLWILDLKSGRQLPLTRRGTELEPWGLAEFVAQEEMGRMRGSWWAPDCSGLLLQHSDVRNVELLSISDPFRPEQEPLQFRYPRAGTPNVEVRLAWMSRATKEPVWIEWDQKAFPYLASVQWSRKGFPTLQVQDREQKQLKLLKIDIEQGTTQPLLELEDTAWVNLHARGSNGYRWISRKDGFLWLRELETGWTVEHRSPTGELLKTLTPSSLPVMEIAGISRDKQIFVVAGPLPARRLYRVPLAGGEPQLVGEDSETPVVEKMVLARRNARFLHEQRSLSHMPRFTVRQLDSDFELSVKNEAKAPPEAPRVTFQRVGPHGWSTAVLRPRDFDPGKRYPTLLHVYGGPHAIKVEARMEMFLREQWVADQGFVIVIADVRGSWGYGQDWERPIERSLGTTVLDEQVQALDAVAQLEPAIDLERVGVYGWSYGGYLSARAALCRPDRFHAAVAGAPVTDWADYDTHYTERYMGLPEKEPTAYEREGLLYWAEKLERPLLLIHGTADDNVYLLHSLKLADALTRHGKSFDLMPLVGQTHRPSDPQLWKAVWQRTIQFFRQHLGVPESP